MLGLIVPLLILLPQIAKNLQQRAEISEDEGNAAYAFGEFTRPQPPAFVQEPPEWLLIVVNTLLLLLLFAFIFYLLRRFRPKPEPQAILVRQVKQALANLETGVDFKDVVMRCYAQMCLGLQENQGIKRPQAMTPREFEAYLADAGIVSNHIQQLTRLFEDVRYGPKTSDAAKENEAVYCLQSILEIYGQA
jgi:hypothetical protein